MRVLVYNEKQGDPWLDNLARHKNRTLNRVCRKRFTVNTPRGRWRKKEIMSAEWPRYVRLVALLGEELRRRDG